MTPFHDGHIAQPVEVAPVEPVAAVEPVAPVVPEVEAPKETVPAVETAPVAEEVSSGSTVSTPGWRSSSYLLSTVRADSIQVKQPTTTHAEAGTLHTEAEPATQVDGTPAEVPATEETPAAAAATTEGEPTATESKVEDKKAAVKVSDEFTLFSFASFVQSVPVHP
jgi:hypothetical protein